jgi:hypothetical protein
MGGNCSQNIVVKVIKTVSVRARKHEQVTTVVAYYLMTLYHVM